MILFEDQPRDLAGLVVPVRGSLVETEQLWEPWRLLDPAGAVVVPVAEFLRDLAACGRSVSTQRSYGLALLRWFRFLWAVEVAWDRATAAEARDFSCWIRLVDKPVRPHWRREAEAQEVPVAVAERAANPVTGKTRPGRKYADTTRAHSESIVRGFYEFHRDAGTGPMVNPFPLARRSGRAHAHHNPMEPHRQERSGRYRPRLTQRKPRSIPDERFNELFASLGSHRDRALVALWVSTGARASELLGATQGDADVGQQLITVVRKGSRALAQLPASPDAFVWLRLYQQQMHGLVPAGGDQPLWWTLRRPFRQLSYHAAHRMFTRTAGLLGADWTLHDLRHTAAYRMARDPRMPITDVQWVLGHASLSTTQIYTNPLPEDVIASVSAHHNRRNHPEKATPQKPGAETASGYRPESLDVLFGRGRS
ncbi:MAG: tyrosine-type recombinase/integrase [Pseudonocardiaceae bacterium]